jgi:hypothetical protein
VSSSASRSTEQQAAEALIRQAVAGELGVTLEPASFKLPGGARVDVDGADPSGTVLVEVYARQGALKGGNFHKVARDALKLITLARAREPAKTTLVIAFADATAAGCVRSTSWLSEALATWGIQVLVADIDPEIRARLRVAQARQVMVNPSVHD